MMNNQRLVPEEGKSEELFLKQQLTELKTKISETENERQQKNIEFLGLDLKLNENQIKLRTEELRRGQLYDKSHQLIQLSTQLELELNENRIQFEYNSKDFDPNLDLMTEKSNYWQQFAKNLSEEEFLLQKEIIQLEDSVDNSTTLQVMSEKAVLEIPDLKRMESTLESEIQKLTEDNTVLKISNKRLAERIRTENNRNEAKLRRLRNQLRRKMEENII